MIPLDGLFPQQAGKEWTLQRPETVTIMMLTSQKPRREEPTEEHYREWGLSAKVPINFSEEVKWPDSELEGGSNLVLVSEKTKKFLRAKFTASLNL